MSYVTTTKIEGEFDLEIEEDDVTSEVQFWENTLILYGMGEDLSMTAVKNFMVKSWSFETLPDMYYHEDGYFLLRFKSHEDMDGVMMKGPYTLRNIPIILKEWRPNYNVKDYMLRTLPIWVKLPKLPLHLWGARSLNKIGSTIGVPLVTDECTAHKLRVSYARILVEVDITRKLADEITIKDPEGRLLKQGIEYEWRPKFCDKCQRVGHQCGMEPKKKVWRPKPPNLEPDPVPVICTPKEDKDKETVVEQAWTMVNKATGDRGQKRIMYVEASTSVPVPCKLREISSRLRELRPDICILLETRVKSDKACSIRNKINLGGRFVDNYSHHSNERIWIHWNEGMVDIRVMNSSSQHIHCGVYDTHGNFRYWLTAIYALNHLEGRMRLWDGIANIHRTQQGPWCVVGDYNNVLTTQDRMGGNLVTEAEYEDLHNMMNSTGLGDMDSCGDFFTWFNNQIRNPIYSRIDRLLANVEWFHLYSEATLNILPSSVSDHALLHVSLAKTRSLPKLFRFSNHLVAIEGFERVVRERWLKPARGRPMQVLWHKLQRLKAALGVLRKPFNDIRLNLEKCRTALQNAQASLQHDRTNCIIIERVKNLTVEVVKWNTREEQILQQR
ncbi:uncharacterized protein LOC131593630 [Vicia villosa]|uniref:uncharacterized protein LOC131593630 n=1 Tax=Vicia villosa TaxID=3911 RepID=UPI00273B5DD1|nr:uncharacterized protein LOC131593630 [Vicia villosa]